MIHLFSDQKYGNRYSDSYACLSSHVMKPPSHCALALAGAVKPSKRPGTSREWSSESSGDSIMEQRYLHPFPRSFVASFVPWAVCPNRVNKQLRREEITFF